MESCDSLGRRPDDVALPGNESLVIMGHCPSPPSALGINELGDTSLLKFLLSPLLMRCMAILLPLSCLVVAARRKTVASFGGTTKRNHANLRHLAIT